MKAILFLVLLAGSLMAGPLGSVNLAWDASSPGTNGAPIAFYTIYYGPASQNYTNQVSVTNALSGTVDSLTRGGVYFFVVTATDTNNLQSLPSNEINFVVPNPPGPPKNLRLISGN